LRALIGAGGCQLLGPLLQQHSSALKREKSQWKKKDSKMKIG
jgi:hypothetical protein